jgi:hypothetical protein
VLAFVALAALVVFVQRRVLGTFFALDDLVLFQQVHGVIPWPLTPWRWLSGFAWFHVVAPAWGENPVPYHAASLAIHVANAGLLALLARRWGASPTASWFAAGVFGVSPLHFTALAAATSVGELLALGFLLLALLACADPRTSRAALLPFALALLAKESVLLVPLAALAIPVAGESAASRLRRVAPLAAGGAVAGALLLAWGVGSGRLGGQAYAAGFGANVVQNVARLASWSLWPREAIPDLHAALRGAGERFWPLDALALTAAAFALSRRPLLRAGAAWWWLAVLPVLPLVGRTYLHYLYVPLAGLALVVAALFDGAFAWAGARSRRDAPAPARFAVPVALALLAAFAAFADRQLAARLSARMPSVDWPLDPVTRKSEIARRAITDVREALAGRRTNVAVLLPGSLAAGVDLGSGRATRAVEGARFELEAVLDGGRSLRAFVPNADTVEFVHEYVPGHAGFTFFMARSDDHVVELGPPPAAHAYVIATMLANHDEAGAVRYADAALADRPDEPKVLYMGAFASEQAGDHAGGIERLRRLVRVAPGDSLAPAARQLLARAEARR